MRALLLPIKDLRRAKQRLAPLLNPEERFALAQAMLRTRFAPFAVYGEPTKSSCDELHSGHGGGRSERLGASARGAANLRKCFRGRRLPALRGMRSHVIAAPAAGCAARACERHRRIARTDCAAPAS